MHTKSDAQPDYFIVQGITISYTYVGFIYGCGRNFLKIKS